MTATELALGAKALAPLVGLVLNVVIGLAMLRAQRHAAERAARDAAKREAAVRRHTSGVVLDEGVGVVLREPGDGGETRRCGR